MAIKTVPHQVQVSATSPLRIGAPQDPLSEADLPVARVGGKAVIQGPSLKGALRSAIEGHLIDEYRNTQALKPCIPASRLTEHEKELLRRNGYRGENCQYGTRQEAGICPVCYLLGAMGLPGFVRVPFLYTDEAPEDLYGVRIDRATSTVARGSNFGYETLPQGTTFVGELQIILEDTVRGWELGKKRPGVRMSGLPTRTGTATGSSRSSSWNVCGVLMSSVGSGQRALGG